MAMRVIRDDFWVGKTDKQRSNVLQHKYTAIVCWRWLEYNLENDSSTHKLWICRLWNAHFTWRQFGYSVFFFSNQFIFFSSLCDNHRLAPLMLATLKSCASCLCYTFREQNSIFEPFCVDNLLLTIDWPNSVHHALEATDRRNMYVVYVVRALLCIRIVVLVTISSVELTWLTWDFIHSDVPKIQLT